MRNKTFKIVLKSVLKSFLAPLSKTLGKPNILVCLVFVAKYTLQNELEIEFFEFIFL